MIEGVSTGQIHRLELSNLVLTLAIGESIVPEFAENAGNVVADILQYFGLGALFQKLVALGSPQFPRTGY